MDFLLEKETQNKEDAIRKEWIVINAVGGYAYSTIATCNTRKYHGLLTVNLEEPVGRYVLLSTLDESICIKNKECFLSTHQYHAQCKDTDLSEGNSHCSESITFPKGYKSSQLFKLATHPRFEYTLGTAKVTREILMLHEKNTTLIKYTVENIEENTLEDPNIDTQILKQAECPHDKYFKITPLFAFRDMHTLTYENEAINTTTNTIKDGFSIKPYNDLPEIYVTVENKSHDATKTGFNKKFLWYKNVFYTKEKERGFDCIEDLWTTGNFYIPLDKNTVFYFSSTTEKSIENTESLHTLWEKELQRREEEHKNTKNLLCYLKKASRLFLSKNPQGKEEIIAGYPWFQAWGRDTLISIKGICFAGELIEKGKEILLGMIDSMYDIPQK